VGRPALSLRFILLALFLILAAVLMRGFWLPWIGEALVLDEGAAKADIAVVLAGDAYGHRIEKAAELVRAGYVPAALIDGPGGSYGNYECDLAIAFIAREGYPREWFIPLPMTAHSTEEEAAVSVGELERRHVRSFLLVTSTYHSARAARIFRSLLRQRGDNTTLRSVATQDEFFRPHTWWRDREARKIVFLEWAKTIAHIFGV